MFQCRESFYFLPTRLRAAFLNAAGPCAGTFPASVDLVTVIRSPNSISWHTAEVVPIGPGCYRGFSVSVVCDDATGIINWLFGADPVTAASLDPFLLEGSGYQTFGFTNPPTNTILCCDFGTVDVVVTEIP